MCSASNDEALRRWNKRALFGAEVQSQSEAEASERMRAVLTYMVRRLSRGVVPDVDVVMDVLDGKADVPACGIAGCVLDFNHCH